MQSPVFSFLISCLSSFLLQCMRRDGISRCICILCYYVTCWLCHLRFSLQIRNYAVFFATKCLYRRVLQEVSTFIYLAFFFTFVVRFVTSLLCDVTYHVIRFGGFFKLNRSQNISSFLIDQSSHSIVEYYQLTSE